MSFKIKRIFLICTIVAAAVGVAAMLGQMKPPPETRETADLDLLIEVMPLEASTVDFNITSQGVVRPLTETIVSAEVSGAIVEVSRKFVAGGVFSANETLLRIDPTNYEVELEQAQALVRQRQIEFDGAEKLKSRGYRAETEYASAAAALASARAEQVRARRNLERTDIRLPYAGMVRAKEVDVGQYVNVGSRLGVTFGTGVAEVRLPLTDSDLAFIDLPAPGDADRDAGSAVTLSAEYRGRHATWPARIVRTEGIVDDRSRVTYAVARVEDPYGLQRRDAHVPLRMGTFVSADIVGTSVANVIRVPRQALRGNSELIFVDEDDRLRIRSVDILRTDRDHAYLSAGAEAGDRISLTAIESPVNGMRVRVDGEDDAESEDDGEQVASGSAQ